MTSLGGSVRPRFCLVTSAHICNNPRLVKEADALHEAGCDVRVVAVYTQAGLGARDEGLMRTRTWRLQRVHVARHERRSVLRWFTASVAQAAAHRAYDAGVGRALVRDQAVSRFIRQLTAAARAHPADVMIGHNLAALPVVLRVGRAMGARVGFDLEDLHSGELPDDPAVDAQRRLVMEVERECLPRCDFLVASSDGIADEVARRYRVARPFVLYNVFPAIDRLSALNGVADRGPGERSLYWYSQVIGPGRGLEEAVDCLSLLPDDVRLHVRGSRDDAFVSDLRHRAASRGVGSRLILHEVVPPDELVARAAQHDIGLALERPDTLNRRLCVTNKLFTFLLAGLAVAATDTPGQRIVMSQAHEAGFLYTPGDVAALARGLRSLLESPAALQRARRAAADVALDRFCWERARHSYVDFLLEQTPRARMAPPASALARTAT